MGYTINLGMWNDIFAVPRAVVDKHMKLAKEDYIKVLLVLLANAGTNLSAAELSEQSGVSEKNLEDALLFWQQCKIIKADNNQIIPAEQPQIEAKTTQNEIKDAAVAHIKEAIKKENKTPSTPVSQNVSIKTRESIHLTSFEVSQRINSSDELKWIVSETERMFGRFLTQTETSVLVSMFDYASIPADVIVMIIEYCISIDKANLRFIEKTAYSWIDKGIDNHQKVEAHITSLVTEKNNETLIKSAFGIWDHNLTTKQKEYICVWLGELAFSVEMIKIAYEKCMDNTGKLSFPYINKVLLNWSEKGFTTPKQIEENEMARHQAESTSSTFNAKEFDDISNYIVPDLSKKKNPRGKKE